MSQPTPAIAAAGLFVAGLLASLAAPAAAQSPSVKIAVVDLDRVIIQSPLGQQMQTRLKELQESTDRQIKGHAEAAQEIRRQAGEGQGKLSGEELRVLQNKLEDEELASRRLQKDAQLRAQKIQEETLSQIQEQLRPVFEKLRDESGYDLILNNTPGVIVLASQSVDITQQVLDTLGTAGSGP